MASSMSLGQKLVSGFNLGRKLLHTGVALGHKVKHLYESPIGRTFVGLLPSGIQSAVQSIAGVGGRLLSGAEQVQQRLRSAEPLVNRVTSAVARLEDGGMVQSVQRAKGLRPEASQRMPALVATSGMRNGMGLMNQTFGKGMSMASFPIGGNVVNPMSMSRPAMMF